MRDTPSHARNHLCLIWKDNIPTHNPCHLIIKSTKFDTKNINFNQAIIATWPTMLFPPGCSPWACALHCHESSLYYGQAGRAAVKRSIFKNRNRLIGVSYETILWSILDLDHHSPSDRQLTNVTPTCASVHPKCGHYCKHSEASLWLTENIGLWRWINWLQYQLLIEMFINNLRLN